MLPASRFVASWCQQDWRDFGVATIAIIIDCDAGLDDAIAIALAAAAPGIDLEAVTTVAGNAPVEITTANAQDALAAVGLDRPVHRGLTGGRDPERCYGTVVWGPDGGDGRLGLDPAPAPRGSPDAVGFLEARLAAATPRTVTLCPIGPLTNIAALRDRRPDLVDRIAHLVVMGGAIEGGNVTQLAEFNIWFDAPAAARTFQSDIPALLVPLDVTNRVVMDRARLDRLAGATTPAARLATRLLPMAGTGGHASAIHDACTIGWLLWPELFDRQRGYISVVCEEGPAFGRTFFTADPAGRHAVLTDVDRDALLDRIVETLCGDDGGTA